MDIYIYHIHIYDTCLYLFIYLHTHPWGTPDLSWQLLENCNQWHLVSTRLLHTLQNGVLDKDMITTGARSRNSNGIHGAVLITISGFFSVVSGQRTSSLSLRARRWPSFAGWCPTPSWYKAWILETCSEGRVEDMIHKPWLLSWTSLIDHSCCSLAAQSGNLVHRHLHPLFLPKVRHSALTRNSFLDGENGFWQRIRIFGAPGKCIMPRRQPRSNSSRSSPCMFRSAGQIPCCALLQLLLLVFQA